MGYVNGAANEHTNEDKQALFHDSFSYNMQ